MLVLALTGISIAQNQISQDGNTYTLGAQVFDRTIYRAGDTVAIYDVVNGDVYCAGNKVIIDAIIDGDLICAANDMVINGSINGNIRVAANNIELLGTVGQNATVFANTFVAQKDSTISGDVTILANEVVLNGQIGRDASIRASSVKLLGDVGRNVQSYHSSFTFDGDGQIEGNFKYSSPNRVYVPIEAVGGQIIQETVEPATKYSSSLTGTVFIASFLYIAWFISLIIAALGVAFLFPKSLEDSVYFATKQPAITVFAGLLTITVTPVALLLLLISVIGIPLGFIIGFMFGTALLLTTPFVAHLIGSLLLPKRSHPVKALAGAAILLLLYAIPLINLLSFMIVTILGVGLVVRVAAQRYSTAHRQYYNK
jgi:cytoskeletal protein CcmA (bactofilin family)